MPRTALIVVVPEAEPLVHEWRLRYDNAELGIPAHVTLIFPFVPADEIGEELVDELRELFAVQPAFSFTLARVARFSDVAWLAPDPSDPFRRLTDLLFSRYPDCPPYEGIHEEVLPHLTVAMGDAALQDEVEAALTPHLPIGAHAGEVTLLVEDKSGHWSESERFPFR
ncbi:MAG: 2'-5' RNA ligase family protein [Gaiellaceae bacterium]